MGRKPAKHLYGTFGLHQRTDGRWQGEVYLGRDKETGRPLKKTFTSKDKQLVIDQAGAYKAEHRQGRAPRPDRQTLEEYLDYWLEHHVKGARRPKTHDSYSQLCESYIIPELGDIRLQKLDGQSVQRFLNKLASQNVRRTGKPMSPRTVQYVHGVLRAALNQAVKLRLLSYNPALAVDPPSGRRPKVKPLLPEEADALINAAKGHRLEPFIVIALETGLRPSETLALTWDCIDFEQRTVRVEKTLQRVKGEGLRFFDPKTELSHRIEYLNDNCLEALRMRQGAEERERAIAGDRWEEHGLVFPNTLGKPADQRRIFDQVNKLGQKAGLERLSLYDMRHGFATLLLNRARVDLKIVSAMMGHSSITLTADTYAHVVPGSKRAAAEAIASLLSRKPLAELPTPAEVLLLPEPSDQATAP